MGVSVTGMPQSKVNQSKVNKTKGNNTRGFRGENYVRSGVKPEISGEKTGVFGPIMPQTKLY